jgi:tRNA uridine 5-carbamoylmethylation protein Kti12
MPRQEEHDDPKNLVDAPHEAEHSARSLQEAADSNATLQGYAAMNKADASEEIKEEAYREGEEETARRKGVKATS